MNLKQLAVDVGFYDIGWVEKNSISAIKGYRSWIQEGRHGPLSYLAENEHIRENPHQLLEDGGAGFLVVLLAMPFFEGSSENLSKGEGWIARYARGRDYHKVMRRKLVALLERIKSMDSLSGLRGRALVDSAPVLERDLASEAGLGWIGKNGLLIHPKIGSSLMIGSLLLSHKPEGIEVKEKVNDHCGHCRACLDSCPTNALDEEYGLDAKKCISTWSIESKGLPSAKQIKRWGNHLFGCDLCQDVCPWNQLSQITEMDHLLEFREDLNQPKLEVFLQTLLENPEYILNGSALKRAGRYNLLRNSLIVAMSQNFDVPDNLLARWRSESDEARTIVEWAEAMKVTL